MKKAIVSAVAILLVSASAFSAPVKQNLDFQKYIAKQISYNTSFANDGFEGTVKVLVNFSATGIESVAVVSGVNDKLDSQIAEFIKNTPSQYLQTILENKVASIVVPVKLVIAEN